MERRRDHRHDKNYGCSLRCLRTRRVIDDVLTADVSASGVRVRADSPHGLERGDRVEVQLFVTVPAQDGPQLLVMGADGEVVRAGHTKAAIEFRAPLAY